ncbi:FliM/FliN family flagellar motor C-terminal domain-containing protein [Acinetobacter sp. ANC 4636]
MKYDIGFLNKNEKNQLIEIIHESTKQWCNEWLSSVDSAIIELREYSIHHQVLIKDVGFVCFDHNQKVGFLNSNYEHWIKILFKGIEQKIPVSALTSFLIEGAQKDFLVKVLENGESKDIGHHLTETNDISFLGIPVVIDITLGNEKIQLLVDSNLVDTRLNDRLNISNNFITLDSVYEEVVNLSIKFNLDKLLVQDLMDIQVGDVIKSNHYLTEPFNVLCNENKIAFCSLGQSENHRAILLTSNHEIKK